MNSAKIKFNVVIKRAKPGKQLERMSFEDVRNVLLVAYGDGFLDDKNFCFCTIITSRLILRIHTGILIHFVWIRVIRASVKPTLEWPKTIFLFY